MAKKTFVLEDNNREKKSKKNNFKVTGKMIIILLIAAAIIIVGAVKVGDIIEESKSYVATVDGIKIRVADFDDILKQVESEYMTQAETDGEIEDVNDQVQIEKFWSAKVDGKTNRLRAKEEALERAKKRAVQLRIGEEKGVALTRIDRINLIKQIEGEVENYVMQYNNAYGYTRYKDGAAFVLENYGLSYDMYKEVRIESYIVSKLMYGEMAKYETKDEDLKSWYNKEPDKYNVYLFDLIYVSFLEDEESEVTETEEDTAEETVEATNTEEDDGLLKGDELKAKKDLIEEIEKAITDKKVNGVDATVADIAKKYSEADTTAYEFTKKDSNGKVTDKITLTSSSISNDGIVIDPINDWINGKGLEKAGNWATIEVKGKADGEYKDSVVGVYIVHYDNMVDYDNTDNSKGAEIRATVKNEVLVDRYEGELAIWAAEKRFNPIFNKDIYEKITVQGKIANE